MSKLHCLSFDQWTFDLICDNSSVNLKLASISKNLFTCFEIHRLNLQVNKILRSEEYLSITLGRVKVTMRSARKTQEYSSDKNHPVLANNTRQPGKSSILDRFSTD